MPPPAFQRAALIFNPVSGRGRGMLFMERCLALLRGSGVEAEAVPTTAPDSAPAQAAELSRSGFDAIFACGGDGTVNQVMHGLIEARAESVLGVVPLGTGNLLSFDLALPRDPLRALEQQLWYTPRRIPAGVVECSRRDGEGTVRRYFTVAAGVGADALIMYQIDAARKQRLGMSAYYLKMVEMAFRHDFPLFEAEFVDAKTGECRTLHASQVIVIRIETFGAFWRRRVFPAGITRPQNFVMIFETRSAVLSGLYAFTTMLGAGIRVPGSHSVYTSELTCRLLSGESTTTPIYPQADGDLLGALPARFSVLPDAFRLLMPA